MGAPDPGKWGGGLAGGGQSAGGFEALVERGDWDFGGGLI